MEIIQLLNVSKYYGQKTALRDINLSIPTKSFTVITGASGAGKSTLLNLIGGLETPSSGDIIVDHKNVGTLSPKEHTNFYRHEIGIIFQGSYLQPQLSLLENITLPAVFSGMPFHDRQSRADELAKMLDISENLHSLPREVSGGQAERACIARALLLNPKIILADEPTNHLDDTNANNVLDLLNSLRSRLGITIVIASHSSHPLRLATQIITIANNTVSVSGRAQ